MNENKEYLVYAEESGSIRISEDVISTIVYNAVMEQDGVASLSTVNSAADIADFFTKKNKNKGIKITFAENGGCNIDIAVMVKYGNDLKSVAEKIQQSVRSNVESMAQLEIKEINIHIDGIVFAPQKPVDTKSEN